MGTASDEITEDITKDIDENQEVELTENETDKMMTIPQLEISTAPKSTANITNLSEEELKMNPELYKMYSYYIPFANHHNSSHHSPHSGSRSRSQLRSQSLPPNSPNNERKTASMTKTHQSPSNHHHRSNMGPRRRDPNFLKPQRSHSYSSQAK